MLGSLALTPVFLNYLHSPTLVKHFHVHSPIGSTPASFSCRRRHSQGSHDLTTEFHSIGDLHSLRPPLPDQDAVTSNRPCTAEP